MIHLTCTSYLHSQPASFDSPEPGHNPMKIDTWPLFLAERQCWHTLYLCLYYGVGKHVVSISPIKPPQPLVSFITYRNLHAKPFATIVTRTVSNSSLSVSALIDSGSAGNLISETLHPLQNNPCESSYKIFSIIGKPLLWHNLSMFGSNKDAVGLLASGRHHSPGSGNINSSHHLGAPMAR